MGVNGGPSVAVSLSRYVTSASGRAGFAMPSVARVGQVLLNIVALAMALLDAFDAVLDFQLGLEAIDAGHKAWGIYLIVATVVAVLSAIAVKVAACVYTSDKSDPDGRRKDQQEAWRVSFYFGEFSFFMIEDNATLMVWYQTGLYDTTSWWSKANLIVTCISLGAVVLTITAEVILDACRTRIEKEKEWGVVLISILTLCLPAAYFLWFAIDVIAAGTSVDNAPNEHYTNGHWFMFVFGTLMGGCSTLAIFQTIPISGF